MISWWLARLAAAAAVECHGGIWVVASPWGPVQQHLMSRFNGVFSTKIGPNHPGMDFSHILIPTSRELSTCMS